MIFKLCNNGLSVFGTDDNGNMVSYSIEAEEYKQWLAEGNTPIAEFTEDELKMHEALSLKAKIPQIITMRQARLQLLTLGLLDDVEAVIGNITDVTTKKTVQIEWEYAKDVERNSPTILLLAQSVGMDELALDNLFVEAAKL